jgi:phosphonate transport system permease protein
MWPEIEDTLVSRNLRRSVLLRFEVNVRGATVIGFVGAGGIGQDLITAIRKFYYSDVSAMLLMIIGTVMVIDMLSGGLRHRLLAMETAS